YVEGDPGDVPPQRDRAVERRVGLEEVDVAGPEVVGVDRVLGQVLEDARIALVPPGVRHALEEAAAGQGGRLQDPDERVAVVAPVPAVGVAPAVLLGDEELLVHLRAREQRLAGDLLQRIEQLAAGVEPAERGANRPSSRRASPWIVAKVSVATIPVTSTMPLVRNTCGLAPGSTRAG